MNLERLTVRSQEALQAAQQTAVQLEHPEIAPEHLLRALLDQEGGLCSILLQRIGVDVPRLRTLLGETLEGRPRARGGAAPQMGDGLRQTIEKAEAKASEFNDDFVSVEHLLLALLEAR